MRNFQILTTIVMVSIAIMMPCQSEAAAGGFCSPVLPPPIPECRVGSISASKSRELEQYIKGNFTAAQRYLTEIVSVTACHPDYLSLNQSERVLGINPEVQHSISTALGSAVMYLKNCFYPVIHQLEHNETLHHMNGRQVHLDTQLRRVEDHIASAVSPLRSLVKSDPRLTVGIECRIPQETCTSLNQINGTPGQIRFYSLWNIARSTSIYLDDLFRMDYWDINNN